VFHGCKLSKWVTQWQHEAHGSSLVDEKPSKIRKKAAIFYNLTVFSPTFAVPKQGHKIPVNFTKRRTF